MVALAKIRLELDKGWALCAAVIASRSAACVLADRCRKIPISQVIPAERPVWGLVTTSPVRDTNRQKTEVLLRNLPDGAVLIGVGSAAGRGAVDIALAIEHHAFSRAAITIRGYIPSTRG